LGFANVSPKELLHFILYGGCLMIKPPNQMPIIRFAKALEGFLAKNEHWFLKPEEKINKLEQQLAEWDKEFLALIGHVEFWIKELEKRME
jgi:hypothetical protein